MLVYNGINIYFALYINNIINSDKIMTLILLLISFLLAIIQSLLNIYYYFYI